jgi:sodium/proline symporter
MRGRALVPFGPVVLFSVMWSRMTRNGALGHDYWCGDGYRLETVRVAGPVRNHPGFIFGSIGIVVFSLLGKAPSAAMQNALRRRALPHGTAIKLQPE